VLSALAVVLVSAGCSSSGGSSDTLQSQPATAATSAGSGSVSAGQGAVPDVVSIQASEWAFAITGSPHAGLVELHVSNVGEKSHELGLARVKDGVSLDQVKSALKQGEAAARALQVDPDTEITSAGIVGPHVNEQVVVPLVAGHYVVTSFLPVSAGATQVDRGMIGEFTVLAPAGTAAAAPATDGQVTLTDSSITLPSGFAHGGTFEVKNTGTKPHDFNVAQLSGQPLPDYFQCVAQSFGAGTSVDDCPGVLQGGVTTLAPGSSAYLTVVFGKGEFGYVSTQGDGADFQAGLNGTFSNA